MMVNSFDDMVMLTPDWHGERFSDGRPKVSDAVLDRLRKSKTEEAWSPLWHRGFKYQFEGTLKMTHPDYKLVGRAVTAVMVPSRPDVHMALLKHGRDHEGRKGFFNQWVVDTLVENDVLVVDMFDKIFKGTYIGGNLSTAIKTKTKNGGAIIWGGIRDLEQIVHIDDFQVYYRGLDPIGIGDCMMTGMNVPCRIGSAICMPGDVVLGTISGVLFIPAHLAEEAACRSEKIQMRDLFAFERLKEGRYTTAQIDAGAWTESIMADFLEWFHHSSEAKNYQYLDWTDELARAKNTERYDFTGLNDT
jgi:regulator of RNase E activity RraA